MLISRYDIADFESEEQLTHRSDTAADTIYVGEMLMFEGPSSEDDNPLNWDPVVEACNKHVALSQVDSGMRSHVHFIYRFVCLCCLLFMFYVQVKVPWITRGILIIP